MEAFGGLMYRARPRTEGIMLHATHTPPSRSNIEHWLLANGRTMGLLTTGYHFVLPRGGRSVIECRPVTAMGTHCKGTANQKFIGVCLVGGMGEPCGFFKTGTVCDQCGAPESGPETPCNQPEDNFTQFQRENLKALVGYLRGLYGPLPLVGHSEERPGHKRQCPPIDMEEARQWVNS